MKTLATRLDGPLLLAPTVRGDKRGFFQEAYRQKVIDQRGIRHPFVQDDHSRSKRGVVRGMRFQSGMAKLVRSARGAILDVVVDIRPDSATYVQWEAHELNDRTLHQLDIPDGFAHGFRVADDLADVICKCSTYYDPAAERGFRCDDSRRRDRLAARRRADPLRARRAGAAAPGGRRRAAAVTSCRSTQ